MTNSKENNVSYNIEDDPKLNALYLLFLLSQINACTIEKLAISLYLFRFINITLQLLNDGQKEELLQYLKTEDIDNLDTLMAPILIEKYNTRFKFGITELLARDLIKVSDSDSVVKMKKSIDISQEFNLEHYPFQKVFKKASAVSNLMNKYSVNEINILINKKIGEKDGKTIH
jgi:hypothetical protein